ncbi:MAG: hypothetical protein AAF844_11810 [Pseudomonadota bacterium]
MPTLRPIAVRLAIAAALTAGAASLPGTASAMTGSPAPSAAAATVEITAPVVEAGHRGFRRGFGPRRRAFRAGRRHGFRHGYRKGYRHGHRRGFRHGGYYRGGPDVFIRGNLFFPPVFGGTIVIR